MTKYMCVRMHVMSAVY